MKTLTKSQLKKMGELFDNELKKSSGKYYEGFNSIDKAAFLRLAPQISEINLPSDEEVTEWFEWKDEKWTDSQVLDEILKALKHFIVNQPEPQQPKEISPEQLFNAYRKEFQIGDATLVCLLKEDAIKAIEQYADQFKTDWKKLREKYFNECTFTNVTCEHTYAPHDLFEWFKANVEEVDQPEISEDKLREELIKWEEKRCKFKITAIDLVLIDTYINERKETNNG